MVRYTIDRTDPGNLRMLAGQNFRPGDEIIAEPAVDTLLIGLEDIFDPTVVLKNAGPFSGVRHFDEFRAKLSLAKRNSLDALFNKDGAGTGSLFATNAFQWPEEIDGHSYTKLGIFLNISRINHSCRPNAFFTWNSLRQKGTIYALDNIQRNVEIVIEYIADTDTSFGNGQHRRKEYDDAYGFKCECGACNLKAGINRRNQPDDADRRQARNLLDELEDDTPRAGESNAASVLRRMGAADNYITVLNNLGIKDVRLANGYKELAVLHDRAFDTARQAPHPANCQLCHGPSGRLAHLEAALTALNKENRVHIRCWGTRHEELAEDDTKRQEIQQKLARNGG